MQHWILCMSSWCCLSPFRKLLLTLVHRNLIRWISTMRLLREWPTLTSFLISFTRSISHLSLAVFVPDCQFWWLPRLKVPMMVVTKTLASVTTGLLIMLPFRHALLTACCNCHFQTILKIQLPLSPRHGLLRLILQSNFLTDIVLQAYKTLVLGKRIKIRPRILVAATGRSCLTITFNICTITCAVATYVHYMILSTCVDILVPNSWFGYRCCSSCSSPLFFIGNFFSTWISRSASQNRVVILWLWWSL